MRWTCEQVEERLSEYLDHLLSAEDRAGFAAHAEGCPRCRPLVARMDALLAAVHRLEPVAEPPRLVYQILDRTLGPRREAKGWRAWFGWLRPVLQVRVGMGVATALIAVVIVGQAAGVTWADVRNADWTPSGIYHAIDRRAHLVYARGAKFVNDLRVVYEIQSRLQPATQREAEPPEQKPGEPKEEPKPPQRNRADELYRYEQLLASLAPAPGRSLR